MLKPSYLPNHDGVIAFLHIPKTAGTTLNSMLAYQYLPNERYEIMMRGMSLIMPRPTIIPRPLISFSKVRRLKSVLAQHAVRLVHGHFDMSLSDQLPSGTRFFTLLRDPIERAISHYCHYRRQADDPIYPLAMRATLSEWVSTSGLVEMDNGQTRRLAGEMNLPCGRVTLRMLDRAKSNLAKYFAVVGLTERFEESLVLLQRQFGWPRYRIPALNVGGNRPPRMAVSNEDLRIIEDCNHFDLDLYRFATNLFEEAVTRIDMASGLGQLKAAPNVRPDAREAPAVSADLHRMDRMADLITH